MFAATGVTTGDYLEGVRFFRGGATTNSVVMRSQTRTVRYLQTTPPLRLQARVLSAAPLAASVVGGG